MISTVEVLRRKGFDLSKYDRGYQTWRVKCSACEALVINGVPCHETGCHHQQKDEDE